MTYAPHTVAAAIANLAERSIKEAGVSDSDTDAMGRIMIEAEEMIANQLVRAGMALQEASEIAAQAALMPGRDSKESDALAEDAYRNRHAGVPNPAPAATAADPSNDAATEPADMDSTQAMSVPAAAPARPAASVGTPAIVRASSVREPQLMEFETTKKKVHEVFRGVDQNDADFDFEVPVVNWAGRHTKIPALDPSYSFDPAHLHTLLYAVAVGASVNIVGPHGCGKTQAVRQVAARLNFPVTTLPMDGQLSRRELIGQQRLRATENGNESYFSAGLLPMALREPGFILFDEVDRGISDLQYACHSVYLQEGLTVLEDGGSHIPFHEFNRVFGTANTKGRGSLDGMYQPPEEMSEATRDRWSLWVEMDYPDVETDSTVLIQKTPGLLVEHAQIIAGIANEIRAAYKEGRLSQTCSMRQQLEVARKAVFLCQREQDDVRRQKALRHAFDRVIGGRASPEDKGSIENLIQIKMPQAFEGATLF